MKLVRTFIYPAILATLALAITCAPASAYNLGRDVTFPNAWTILATSNRAMNRVGTAHGVGLSKLTTKVKTSKGIKTVMDEGVFIGDATTKQSRQSHVVVRAVQVLGSKAVSLTYNYITDGKKLATENRASKWVCQPMSLLNRIPEWTPITFGLVVKQTKANTAKTVGSLIFQGTPVWHVLLKSQAKKNDAKQVIELLIDQKTNLVKSMKILNSGISKGEPWTESMALGLTKFGEPVKVTLPAGC